MIKNWNQFISEDHHIDARVSYENGHYMVRQGNTYSGPYATRQEAQEHADWLNNEDGDQYYKDDVWSKDNDNGYWERKKQAEREYKERRSQELADIHRKNVNIRNERLKNDDNKNIFLIYGITVARHTNPKLYIDSGPQKIYYTGDDNIINSFSYDPKDAKIYETADEADKVINTLDNSVIINSIHFRKNEDGKIGLGKKIYTKKGFDRLK